METTNHTSVIAVIAAYNEADRIDATVRAARAIPSVTRVLVVDDGSADATSQVAQQAGAEVLRLSKNAGKGKALQKAVADLTDDVTLFLDGDLGECAAEAQKILDPVVRGVADMAIADFPKPQTKGGIGLAKGLGRWAIKRFTGVEMAEPLSGQRAVKTGYLKGLEFESGYGLEVGLSIDILKQGCRVVEVPVNMTHRETGRNFAGFMHRGRQFLDILRVIFRRTVADT
ncbi:MAG TPA: glycosyltransferase family 2 protein [Candidatus Aquicultor sp.]|jgi:glycosyltransferase involved in cell wall biosynthesis